MDTRIRITLDPDLHGRARARAAELGISFQEYVRRLLANDLGRPNSKADISPVFDLGASDQPPGAARNKRQILDEAVWQEHLRKLYRPW
jgi:hypothetical protein